MNVRNLYHVLLYVAFPVGAVGIMFLAAEVNRNIAILIFPFSIFLYSVIMSLKCPNCKHKIGRPKGLKGMIMAKFCVDEFCEYCGYDLTQKKGPKK